MKPHKHAELIKAWADGAEIQYAIYKSDEPEWHDCGDYFWWSDDNQYRIKPQPKPDVFTFAYIPKWYVLNNGHQTRSEWWIELALLDQRKNTNKPNIKITFDGETGKLKSAEVL